MAKQLLCITISLVSSCWPCVSVTVSLFVYIRWSYSFWHLVSWHCCRDAHWKQEAREGCCGLVVLVLVLRFHWTGGGEFTVGLFFRVFFLFCQRFSLVQSLRLC